VATAIRFARLSPLHPVARSKHHELPCLPIAREPSLVGAASGY